jgi:hypothetical protein
MTMTLGDTGGRSAPARGVPRHALARMIAAREIPARRTVNGYLLGLDDATFAAFGYERKSIERAGRGPFPL